MTIVHPRRGALGVLRPESPMSFGLPVLLMRLSWQRLRRDRWDWIFITTVTRSLTGTFPQIPLDLEQREGRIHPYKGHAIRKNLADKFSSEALQSTGADAWEEIFAAGLAGREPGQNQLVPFWLFPGNAKIERHVPRLPFSREVERLDQLRQALAIYRMVFGQSRQEDLITYLLVEVPEKEREELVRELQIDLSPPSKKSGTGRHIELNGESPSLSGIK